MGELVDALTGSIVLLFIAWSAIVVPSTAAFAHRRGLSPGLGALLGCIPLPFAGCLVVLLLSRRRNRAPHETPPMLLPTTITPREDAGW